MIDIGLTAAALVSHSARMPAISASSSACRSAYTAWSSSTLSSAAPTLSVAADARRAAEVIEVLRPPNSPPSMPIASELIALVRASRWRSSVLVAVSILRWAAASLVWYFDCRAAISLSAASVAAAWHRAAKSGALSPIRP